MSTEKFERGDVVLLKSGSPLMVVDSVTAGEGEVQSIVLRWFCKETNSLKVSELPGYVPMKRT